MPPEELLQVEDTIIREEECSTTTLTNMLYLPPPAAASAAVPAATDSAPILTINNNIQDTMIDTTETSSPSSYYYEPRMLDHFPLNEEELKHILEGYSNYVLQTKSSFVSEDELFLPTFGSIFSSQLLVSSLSQEEQETTETQDGTSNCTSSSNNNGNGSDKVKEQLHWAEQEFLPEAGSILQQAISNVFLIGSGNDDSLVYQYLEAIVTLLGRRGSPALLSLLYQVAERGLDNRRSNIAVETVPAAEELVDLVYRCILALSFIKYQQPSVRRRYPQAWVNSLMQKAPETLSEGGSGRRRITMPVWKEWVRSVAPEVDKALSTFCHYAIFGPRYPFRSTNTPLMLPRVLLDNTAPSMASALWTFPYQGVPASMGILSPNLGGPWVRLYSSDLDGCSFRAMQEALLTYHGTTVILIQTTAGDSFGFYSNCPWKESKRWFGQYEANESFLFGLKPSLQYYGPSNDGGKPYYMFLHNPVYANPTDLNGLAIGGINDKTPRLQITTNFENCKAGNMDIVYESGPLLSNGELFFDIDVVEVFAVNCDVERFERALREGRAHAAVREGARLRAAQVDRKQFLEDFQSGQYMNRAFGHREQVRGRHSFVAHDDESSGYFIESKLPTPRRSVVEKEG
jgi:hypothetical protein